MSIADDSVRIMADTIARQERELRMLKGLLESGSQVILSQEREIFRYRAALERMRKQRLELAQ